jgi:hypothetical protein
MLSRLEQGGIRGNNIAGTVLLVCVAQILWHCHDIANRAFDHCMFIAALGHKMSNAFFLLPWLQIAKQAHEQGAAMTADGGISCMLLSTRLRLSHYCFVHSEHPFSLNVCVAEHNITADFVAQGQPFGKLPGEVQAALASIAQQRLFALGWVLQTHDWME